MKDLVEIVLNFLENILSNYGIPGSFFAFLISEIVVFTPTSVLISIAGFILLPNNLSWELLSVTVLDIAIPAAFGITIGSLIFYFLGFFLGKPFLEKWGKFFNLSWDEVERFEKKLEKSYFDEAAIFGLRAIPIFPTSTVSFVCGLIRIRMRSYLIFTFIGVFVRVLILSALVWQAGVIIKQYGQVFQSLEIIGFAIILIILFFLIKKGKIFSYGKDNRK